MKIAWIRIKGFQQFEDVFIDFRHPETGKPLDKICFIGRNGTGKSTLLELLERIVLSIPYVSIPSLFLSEKYSIAVGLMDSAIDKILVMQSGGKDEIYEDYFDTNGIKSHFPDYIDKIIDLDISPSRNQNNPQYFFDESFFSEIVSRARIVGDIFHDDLQIIISVPSETSQNVLKDIEDLPETNLDEALQLFKYQTLLQVVSNETAAKFWNQIIYLIKKRENDRQEFENLPENGLKIKNELKEEFEKYNPDILKEIAVLWNDILEKAGLRFDYENAKKPIQLTENLQAYILNKHNEKIGYNKLSTGIRNFIFRFGHIKSLYFNKEIDNAFLFVDEPENSLFPDFLLNIIEKYQEITTDKRGENNTQMFFATHSPLIAAQFEPYERVILDWDENGSVKTFRGTAPIGDDPNDVLNQDFGMNEVVSHKGQEVWNHYQSLKKELRKTDEGKKKEELVAEISEIGRKYNF